MINFLQQLNISLSYLFPLTLSTNKSQFGRQHIIQSQNHLLHVLLL